MAHILHSFSELRHGGNHLATTLQEILDARTRPGELYQLLDGENNIRCFACGLRCLIRAGRRGVCRVRYNDAGTLQVPSDYVVALQCDPIEKKPFYHALPGSGALSFGMLGCDLHCDYCQNWITSQALRDDAAGVGPRDINSDEIVDLAAKRDARFVVSTYNEPLITSEWAAEIFDKAKAKGFRTAYVSNGNATPEALDYLRPRLDAFKIDLKTMSDRKYRKLGGVLQHILDTVREAHARGFWVEVVTLVVPGFNDSEAELVDAAEFVASVSTDIPWHVIAFHKDYRMQDPADTTARQLVRAAEIGAKAGLDFVYAGNLPGQVGRWEHTHCPHCDRRLIERLGHSVRHDELSPRDGNCPGCGVGIPGIWS